MTKNVEVRVDQEASRVRRRSVSEQSTSKGGREEDCFCDHKDEVGAIISAPSGRFATTLPQGDGTLNLLMDFESEGGVHSFPNSQMFGFCFAFEVPPLAANHEELSQARRSYHITAPRLARRKKIPILRLLDACSAICPAIILRD